MFTIRDLKKPPERTWFDRLALDWVGCPAIEGIHETTCHTEEGNNIALYIQTTRDFNEWYHNLFSNAWNYFSGRFKKMNGNDSLFFPEGLPDHLKYALYTTGTFIPTYMGNYFYPRIKKVFPIIINKYISETGDSDIVNRIDGDTLEDINNWLMRLFQDWLNENKRYKEKE